MTIVNKTPSARRAARDYFRRCLAVMLCCVFVFGMTTQVAPRAKAVAAAPALAVGSATSLAPVAGAVGLFALVACGVDFTAGYMHTAENTPLYGTRGYDLGAACWDYLYGLGGDIADWCMTIKSSFETKGGVAPGDSFTIPPDVAAAIQQWTVTNFNFTDGIVTYSDYILNGGGNAFVLSDVDTIKMDAYTSSSTKRFFLPVIHVGSLVGWPTWDLSSNYTSTVSISNGIDITYTYTYSSPYEGRHNFLVKMTHNLYRGSFGTPDNSLYATSGYKSTFADVEETVKYHWAHYYAVLLYSKAKNRIYAGAYQPNGTTVDVYSNCYLDLTDATVPQSITTTLTNTSRLETAPTEDVVAHVPADLVGVEVGGYSVPAVDTLTGADVLNPGTPVEDDPPAVAPGITAGEITGAITDALPVTGTIAGDAVVEEVMADPDSLGALLISKFPFCIPWDVVKAIKLLAAPPVTPRWELDFMEPISYRVGGFPGSTKVVLDFSDYEIIGIVTRWTSTIMFVYALASGTKRLMWTA